MFKVQVENKFGKSNIADAEWTESFLGDEQVKLLTDLTFRGGFDGKQTVTWKAGETVQADLLKFL